MGLIMSVDFNREDLVYNAYAEKLSKLSTDIQDRIKNFNYDDLQLRKIKAKRPKHINTGDVFVLSPRENLYFYGHVLNGEIKTIDNRGFIVGNNLVVIYRLNTDQITMDRFISATKRDFLFSPCVVHRQYWTQGYFFTIGNCEFDFTNPDYDYGFLDLISGLVNEEGEELDHIPKWIDYRGITTLSGIATYVEKELIMDPSLEKLIEIK